MEEEVLILELSCSYPEAENINDIFPSLLFDSQTINIPKISLYTL